MVNIIFARHPETEGNADKKLIWSADIPLSEKWIRQVFPLVKHVQNNIEIKNRPVNIFTNKLERCWIVAALCRNTLTEFTQWIYSVEKNLMERDFGKLQHKTKEEILHLFPQYNNLDTLLKQNWHSFESTERVRQRVHNILHKIVTHYPDDNNIIFSSSSIGRSIISVLLKHKEEDFEKIHGTGPRNCELRKRTSKYPDKIERNALLVSF